MSAPKNIFLRKFVDESSDFPVLAQARRNSVYDIEYIRADLLRPSDEAFQRQVKRALIILSKWGDDAPADQKVEMAREILQKALASIPRADSPEHIPDIGEKVEDHQVLLGGGLIERPVKGNFGSLANCPHCDGIGEVISGSDEAEIECPRCKGSGEM